MTSLSELRPHVMKHMKSGKRGKVIRVIDHLMNPDQTPVLHQSPSSSSLEAKFRVFFPEEFRDSSPEDEKADTDKDSLPSTPKTATRSNPSPNVRGEFPSTSTSKSCLGTTPQKDVVKEVKQSPENHEEFDILQQLLGSQEETLPDVINEKPMTGNSQHASPIPPELQVMVEGKQIGPPKIVPFKKEEYSSKLK
ncbi:hypothetical protein TNCV_2396441 [Trichonephila clavipes]|uniref:Uncharacterized protein n=1 Tax=Trichonephila clavipes TaxID=2585209 RepID=A0A8X6SV81_TRICX|nr:hypothetical protein TNCV_2396441 [Trichonephila clavipes]